MAKESYYFSHDYDPTGDPKMQAMLGNYGGLGYGIFWRLVEMLHADDCHRVTLKPYVFEAIAKQMLTNAQQVSTFVDDCVNKFELFQSDGAFIWSNRVIRNIEKRVNISNIRAESGRKSAAKRQQMSTNAEQLLTSVEQNPTKERKGKESKDIKLSDTAIGVEVVVVAARKAWDNQIWREQTCMAHLVSEDDLKRWMAQYNASICNDFIADFNEKKYMKMFGGWMNRQREKGYKLQEKPQNGKEQLTTLH